MGFKLIAAGALFLAMTSARGEQFDRTADLPDLAKAVGSASNAMAGYKKSNQSAEAAAKSLASGYNHLPKEKSNAAKAADLLQLEGSLNSMLANLDVFFDSLTDIQNQIEGGTSQGLGEMRGRLDDLVAEFSNQVAEKERVSSLLMGLSELSPDAVGEKEAGQLNFRLDELAQRRKMVLKMHKSSERIGVMTENIEQKVETIKAIASVVEARIAELRCESMLVKVLKEDHKVAMVIDEMTGPGKPGDPTALFDSKPSGYLDQMMGREGRRGGVVGNQRAILRARLKAQGESR